MTLFRAAYIVFLGVMSGCGAAPVAPSQASGPETEGSAAPSTARTEPGGKTSQGAPPAAGAKAPSTEPTAAAPSENANPSARSSPLFASFPDLAESPGAPELAAGAKSVLKESWLEARVQIERAIPLLEAGGRLDTLVAAHTLRGRSCAKLGDAACAEKAFQRAIDLWEMPGAEGRLRATGSDDAQKGQHLARALSAVGEALFSLADQKRKELDGIRFPEYKGADTNEGVQRFMETKVAEWVTRKTPKVEEVESAYRRVLAIAPEPPPRFAVASAARIGQIWGKFGAEFRAAPIPGGWKARRFDELRDLYYSKLDAVAEPVKARAMAKFERCRALAEEVQQKDDFSRSCEQWLQKQKPQEASAQGDPSQAPFTRP